MKNKKILAAIIILLSNILAQNVICQYCISSIDSSYVKYNDKIYHPDCFNNNLSPTCEKCKQSILSEYKTYNNKLFHPMCYKNIKFHRCQICYDQIKENYIEDIWGNKLHKNHLFNSQQCFHCNRIISEGLTKGGYQLEDGRTICKLCEQESIVSLEDIEQSRNNVLKQLNRFGFQNLLPSIKIVMVDQKKLSLYSGNYLPGTIFIPNITGYTKSLNGEYVIYILNYTPKIEFEAILAHEYLHVWQLENRIQVDNETSEGISSLGNFIIYSNYNNEYSKVKLKQMNSTDYIYKTGYSNIKNQIEENGWDKTIQSFFQNNY